MNPNLKKWASLALTTFASGFLGYLMPALSAGVPTEGAAIKSMLLSAAIGGLSALVHLYQLPPAPAPVLAAQQMARRLP
jgi:hypothetical protein